MTFKKFLTGSLFIFLILIYFFCDSANLFAQGKSYPFNVSAWYKALSINRSDKDIAGVNLTLFYTDIGSIKTFNTGLGFTRAENNMSGVNLNAGVTSVGGNSRRFYGFSYRESECAVI